MAKTGFAVLVDILHKEKSCGKIMPKTQKVLKK